LKLVLTLIKGNWVCCWLYLFENYLFQTIDQTFLTAGHQLLGDGFAGLEVNNSMLVLREIAQASIHLIEGTGGRYIFSHLRGNLNRI
jgi:hypothetical protein